MGTHTPIHPTPPPGSLITLIFDTESEGGKLSFELDGVPLKSSEGIDSLTNVYAMLGSNQVFPCLCISPLDELPPPLHSEPPKGVGEVKKKVSAT